MKRTLFTILAAGVVSMASSHAAISIANTSFTYSQNFNTLLDTGTTNAWTNNSTISGWSLFTATGSAITTYRAGTGDSNAGAFYSFGTTAEDRALGGTGSGGAYFGSPSTGSVAGYVAVAFTNSTSTTLNSVTIAFDGEQWRNGGNATAQSMVLEYGFGTAFTDVTSWTAPGGSFDWTTPIATATAAAVDGNVAGLVAGRGGIINSITWTNGSTLWLRWIERNDTGNDHGLAIDNFTVTAVTAIPEPSTAFAGILLGLGLLRRRRRA